MKKMFEKRSIGKKTTSTDKSANFEGGTMPPIIDKTKSTASKRLKSSSPKVRKLFFFFFFNEVSLFVFNGEKAVFPFHYAGKQNILFMPQK